MIKAFVPKERHPGETRVAIVPETVRHLAKADIEVQVEAGAGEGSYLLDADYEAAGAKIVSDPKAALAEADLVLKVRHLEDDEAKGMKEGAVAIGLLAPYAHLDMVQALADRKIESIAMELVPRITRAQSMDVLSSQASIAGYKAVLMAAANLGKYFPLLMTAAGTIQPARVVIMGAGVAGLQAIATAKRLGAMVEVSDIREEVKEQVESLGGRFIDLPDMQSGEGDRRLRPGDERGLPRQAAGDRRRARHPRRRGHHHRAGARQGGAGADHHGHGQVHAPRLGDRRPGRGAGRQLRALGRRRGRGEVPGDDPRPPEPPGDHAPGRLHPLRPERPGAVLWPRTASSSSTSRTRSSRARSSPTPARSATRPPPRRSRGSRG